MTAERLKPDEKGIRRAVALLARGELVAFPTETVYGLGADATNAAAVRRIYEAKGRPANNPLIIHVPDAAAASRWASDWTPLAARLAGAFWPGPLTVVVPAAGGLVGEALGHGTTVGLRAPDHPVALALLRACGRPLAAPSANPSGTLSPVSADHVLDVLGDRIAAVVDGGACRVGIESTVVDCTGAIARLLRPGILGPDDIGAALGAPAEHAEASSGSPGVLRSPGLLDRHYAPSVPLLSVDREALRTAPRSVARVWLGAQGEDPVRPLDRVLPGDPAGAAARLYALLWELQGSGAEAIWIEMLPGDEPWRALRDRLRRASANA